MQEQNNNSSPETGNLQDVTSPTVSKHPDMPKPEELTEKQIRELRRIHVTRRNPTVIACKHKLHLDKCPTNNCIYCWQAYFCTQANIEELFGDLREMGVKKFTAKYGTKFTKNLRGFVAAELMKGRKVETEEKKRGTGWDNNGLGIEIEGEKLEIEGTPIPPMEEVACELKLQTGSTEKEQSLPSMLPTTLNESCSQPV